MTLLINERSVRELLDMETAITAVEKTFSDLGNDRVVNPSKVNLDLGQTGDYPYFDGFINAMPAYVEWVQAAGLKWVVGMAGKRQELGLPYINSILVLADPETGEFTSVMNGTYISNIRTGAQSAVALSHLLDKSRISVGMYGAGVQAKTQIEALSHRFEIENLTVYNHRRSTAENFAEEMQKYIINPIAITTNPADAADHDVLITVTLSQEPFLKADMVKPGTIIMPMGSFQEITDELILKTTKLYVDHAEQAFHRGALKHLFDTGKIHMDQVDATISDLVNSKTSAPDLSNEITLCIPIGMGALDVALAAEVFKKANEKNIGTQFSFD